MGTVGVSSYFSDLGYDLGPTVGLVCGPAPDGLESGKQISVYGEDGASTDQCGSRLYTDVVSVDFVRVFAALKPVLASQASRLSVRTDAPDEYTLVTKSPSPFPQHKGQPMWFGAVKVGKAYVSYHLMPLYMNPTLTNTISPALKKRMQGKSCFNFTVALAPDVLAELTRLTSAAVDHWARQGWL
jgi:hypothetical protein